MPDQLPEEVESNANYNEILVWPIILILVFTSVPAGFLPFATAGDYRDMRQDERENPKLRNEARLESERSTLWFLIALTVGMGVVQLSMSGLACLYWNTHLFGMRGALFFALIWGAFAVGCGFGLWCDL